MSKLIARKEKKTGPTQSEVWFQHLQRQVMHLLLRHDQQLFRRQFRTFFAQSALSDIPLLQLYDRYIRLQVSGDELLNEVLPDIERQLSLQNDFEFLLEDTPIRGDPDWQRTLMRTINESPDQPPQRYDMCVLRQNMATPENLLVVAILLHYRQAVQDVLQIDIQQEILDDQGRLVLFETKEDTEHKLDKPYARELREEAGAADIEMLVEQVKPRLKPGANPYRNLIIWWENFRDLHIGKTVAQRHLALASQRSNEQMERWLYELWIALEILDFLNASRLIVSEMLKIESDRFNCLFTWGEQRFSFCYQRSAPPELNEAPDWQGAISTYMIEREQPLKGEIDGNIIWQEPPILLAASYSGQRDETSFTQNALRQLLGDMQLKGSHHGGLFSPMLPDLPNGRQWSDAVQIDEKKYSERSDIHTNIRLYKILPDMARDILLFRLRTILQDSVEALPERSAPACYGILLDSDTVNASRRTAHSGNVLCPKPHIGPGVFDLVDYRLHCLKDPRLCHVYGQPITPPFVIRIDTLDHLEQQNGDLRSRTEERLREAENASDETRAERLRGHIFLGVGRAVEQYVQLHGHTTSIEERFEDWIFGNFWKKHQRSLSEETRNNLLSGEYVWEEYKRTNGLNDWAAPAIQYCRALEKEIHRRIHDYYPDKNTTYADVGQKGFNGQMTLGFLETIFSYKGRSLHSGLPANEQNKIRSANHNWPLCEAVIRQAKSSITDFEQVIQRIIAEGVTPHRNKLAHGDAVSQSDAQALHDAIIGRKEQPGILIWLAENLEPKR